MKRNTGLGISANSSLARISFKRRRKATLAISAATAALGAILPSRIEAATQTWTGNTTNQFNAIDGFVAVPSSGDSLAFGAAGSQGTTLSDNLLTPASFNIAGITYNAGASSFTINPASAGTNGFTLTGNITNSAGNLQTIADWITLSAASHTITVSGGTVSLTGSITGTGSLTTAGSGVLKFGASNSYTGTTTVGGTSTVTFASSNLFNSANNLVLSTGTVSNTIDLAGTSQIFGTLTSGTGVAGTVTSSTSGGVLTLNEGGTNANAFGGTLFSGQLGLVVRGNTTGNVQIQNVTNSFSGGLTVQSSSASSLTTANFAVGGGLTGQSLEGVRSSAAAALGTGSITLDNGQIFLTSSVNVTNNFTVTSRGASFHMEGTGTPAAGNPTTGFTGTITDNGGVIDFNSNSGNNNIIPIAASFSGSSGTLALDTTNIGGIALTNPNAGNSNMNVVWFGNGANGGTGRVRWNGVGNATLTFGELSNLNSGAPGSTMSGVMENNVAGSTVTYVIGDTTNSAPIFQGVIRNGGTSGITALTKQGTNTQILSGSSTYTGVTTINGGTLAVATTGAITASSAVTVNSSGAIVTQGSGSVASPVTVNGGGTIGGYGTYSGVVTLAAGTNSSSWGSISTVDSTIGTLSFTNAAGLTLGGTAGNLNGVNLEANASTSDRISLGANALNVGTGGFSITITSLGVAANQSYPLFTYGSGTGAGFAVGTGTTVGAVTLSNPTLSFGVSGYLSVSGTGMTLVTTGASAPNAAYWSGVQGSHWNDNSGGSGNFTSSASGTTAFLSALPAANTDVFFANNSQSNLTNTLGQAFDIHSLNFLAGTGAVNIGGSSALQIEAGGISVGNTGGATISTTSLVLGADQTWNNTTASALVVTSAVSGSASLTVNGPVTLGGSTFSVGNLTVNGTLDVEGTSPSVANLAGSGTITNSGASGTLSTTVTGSSTFAGSLTDSGSGKTLSLAKNGSGVLILTGNNSNTGMMHVNAGTLVLGSAGASGAGTISVNTGATLDLDGQSISNTIAVVGTGVGGGGALVNSDTIDTASINSDMLSQPSFTIGGPGAITLQRAQSGSVFTLTDNSTGTLTLGNNSTSTNNNLLNLIVNSGTVLFNMPGNQIASDRGLTINNATVRYIGSSTNEISDGNTVTMSNGVLDMNNVSDTVGPLAGTGTLTNAALSSGTSTYTNSTNSTTTFSGAITDNAAAGGGLLNYSQTSSSGVGIQTFSASNSYHGLTTINGGTLIAANDYALGDPTATTAGANLTGSTAVLALTSANPTIASLASTNASAKVILGNVSTNSATTLTVGGNNNSTSLNGVISDGSATSAGAIGALVKVGTGTLTLSGSNTYTGGTTIKNGILAQAGPALGTGTITLGDGTANNATLLGASGSSINNPNAVVISAGTGTYAIRNTGGGDYNFNGTLTLNAPVTLATTANGASFYRGLVVGSSTVTIDGGGTTTKFVDFANTGNSATFTGALVIQNKGSFKTLTGGVGPLNTVYMDGGSTTFDTGVQSVTVAGFNDVGAGPSSANVINAGANTLSLAGSGTYSFSGAITSSGSIAKTGTGLQVLAGMNTYTGGTSVTAGTLDVTGAITGSPTFTVAANSSPATLVLDGTSAIASSAVVNVVSTGTFASALTVNSGQSFAYLNSTGAAAFNSGSTTIGSVDGTGSIAVGSSATLIATSYLNHTALASNGSLVLNGGTSTIGSISGTGSLAVTSGATLNVTNAIQHGAIASDGDINVNGGSTNAVGTVDGAGTLALSNGANLMATYIRQGTLLVGPASTASIAFDAQAHTHGTPIGTSVVSELSVDPTGTLDLKNNGIVILDTTSLGAVKSLIAQAADVSAGIPHWDMPGITSSIAAADHSHAIGYALASTLPNGGSTSFNGITFSDAVIARYTLVGDSSLKGTVDLSDYTKVVLNLGKSNANWSDGNFDYSGNVNLGDYTAVIRNLGRSDGQSSVFNSTGPAAAQVKASALTLHAAPAVTQASTATDVTLLVNPTNGRVTLVNALQTGQAVITAYTINSPSQSLLPFSADGGGKYLANALENNPSVFYKASNGLTYNLWTGIKNVSTFIGEGFSNHYNANVDSTWTNYTLATSGYALGTLFKRLSSGGTRDLVFQWEDANLNTYTSVVTYVGTVPEPGSVSLVAVGAMAMLGRRRRRSVK